MKSPPETHKFRMLAQEPHSVHKSGREWRVGADRFPIAKTVTGVILDLEPGGFRELHWHPNADEWQYVIEGKVSVTLFGSHGRYRTEELEKGDVGYIPQGYGHSIENVGKTRSRVLIGFNTGHYEAIDLSDVDRRQLPARGALDELRQAASPCSRSSRSNGSSSPRPRCPSSGSATCVDGCGVRYRGPLHFKAIDRGRSARADLTGRPPSCSARRGAVRDPGGPRRRRRRVRAVGRAGRRGAAGDPRRP